MAQSAERLVGGDAAAAVARRKPAPMSQSNETSNMGMGPEASKMMGMSAVSVPLVGEVMPHTSPPAPVLSTMKFAVHIDT